MRAVMLLLIVLCSMSSNALALSCSATITDVNFGTPNLLSSTPTDVTATLTVSCNGIAYNNTVKICPGIEDGSGGSSGASRLLTGFGGSTPSYQLFQDSGRTLGWGATSFTALGTIPYLSILGSYQGTGQVTHTIYARFFGSQTTIVPGSYHSVFATSETDIEYRAYASTPSNSCAGWSGTASTGASFDVTATPGTYCQISAQDIAFGSVGVLTSAQSATGGVTAACTRSTPYTIFLDGGQAGAQPTVRHMSKGSEYVTYGLYRDAGHTQPWGDVGSSLGESATGSGSNQTLTVYGNAPAQATPSPGNYSDRVVATVSY